MEFRIPIEELQSIFSRMSYIVRMNDGGIPGMVLAEAREDGMTFKCTDGNMHLLVEAANFETITPGKMLFRFRDLRGYVSKFIPFMENYGTRDFHFTTTDNEGLLKTKTEFPSSKPAYKKLKFLVFEPSVYPIVKPFDEAQLIINSNVLKFGVEKVLHCINPTDIRLPLTGVNMTIMNDKVIFVGSNGVKLAEFGLIITADINKKSYILRYNFASALKSVLDNDAQVFMKFDSSNVYAKSNRVYLTGNLIIGEAYPNYKEMFTLTKSVEIPRLDFSDSVKTVMDVLDPEDNNRLTIKVEGNKIILRNDKTEAVHEFERPFEHELDMDVNGLFLESLLRDYKDDVVRIEFGDKNPYIIIKSPNNENQTSLLTMLKRR